MIATSKEKRSARDIVCSLLEQATPVHVMPHGSSMTPLIREGDLVRVRPVGHSSIRPGHIVLFLRHSRLILHRVVRYESMNKQYIMAADAALSGLDTISETTILGIAEWVRHGARERRIDTCSARWTGLARFYLRTVRRLIFRIRQRVQPR